MMFKLLVSEKESILQFHKNFSHELYPSRQKPKYNVEGTAMLRSDVISTLI